MRLEGLKEWGTGDRFERVRAVERPSTEARIMVALQLVMILSAILLLVALGGDAFATLGSRAKDAAIEIAAFQKESQRGGILSGVPLDGGRRSSR